MEDDALYYLLISLATQLSTSRSVRYHVFAFLVTGRVRVRIRLQLPQLPLVRHHGRAFFVQVHIIWRYLGMYRN